uniref:Cathelicidin-5 n=1 Tax=Bos indicus x Bos taurus TaxID=30522 RepID=A0A4W2I5Q3_BOBOX
MGSRGGQGIVGDGETISSPCTGDKIHSLPCSPVRQQQELRQVQLMPWEEGRDGVGQEGSRLNFCIRAQTGHKGGSLRLGGGRLGTMETQRASLSLGRWSLWLLLLGLVLPSASAQALSYREAVLRAVDQLNEKSSEANLYRLLELDPPPKEDDENPNIPKPVSFRVKETVCPRTSQQPPEQCDFKENGLVKQCVGTVTLDPSNDQFDINCNELQSVRFRPPIRRPPIRPPFYPPFRPPIRPPIFPPIRPPFRPPLGPFPGRR